MTCRDFEIDLGDYVDGTLADQRRPVLLGHLGTCERCRGLVADLQTIHHAARALEPEVPSPQVWMRVQAAVESGAGRPSRVWSFWSTVAAVATTVMLVVSLSWLGGQLAAGRATPSVQTSAAPDLQLAEAPFTDAISGLESIAKAEQATLDAETADVLQANLTVIDGAIRESRAALETYPDSQAAQESLFEALRSKVELLQDIVALINEMRKGNPEGAARIVSGVNQ
jgi:anti-sigma factor RsiW